MDGTSPSDAAAIKSGLSPSRICSPELGPHADASRPCGATDKHGGRRASSNSGTGSSLIGGRGDDYDGTVERLL
jgi:hypothetical protein